MLFRSLLSRWALSARDAKLTRAIVYPQTTSSCCGLVATPDGVAVVGPPVDSSAIGTLVERSPYRDHAPAWNRMTFSAPIVGSMPSRASDAWASRTPPRRSREPNQERPCIRAESSTASLSSLGSIRPHSSRSPHHGEVMSSATRPRHGPGHSSANWPCRRWSIGICPECHLIAIDSIS